MSDGADKRPMCGLVMPISPTDGYPAGHWNDVQAVLIEAVGGAGFDARLVSTGGDVAIIQKRIIQNLYEDTIIVCDVSSRNTNVMLELGMRLAFNKPVVIAKDDATVYPFDTAPIEYVEYPHDLRYGKINEFKKALGDKVSATYQATKSGVYTPFLKHYGEFTVATLDQKEVSGQQYAIEELKDVLISSIQASERNQRAALAKAMNDVVELINTRVGPSLYTGVGLAASGLGISGLTTRDYAGLASTPLTLTSLTTKKKK